MPATMNHNDAVLRICVDKIDQGRFSGRVFSRRLTAPLLFQDAGTLLLTLDRVLSAQNFPQAFQRTRSFLTRPAPTLPIAPSLSLGMDADTVQAARGSVDTILLYVITRRNTTWQGFLAFLDDTPRQEFASVLELLRLIDARLSQRT